MKNRCLLLITLFSLVIFSLHAQPTSEALVDTFFSYYKSSGINKAIDYVFATNKYMTQSQEVIDNIKLRFNKATPQLGQYCGYDLFIKREAGPSYIFLSYIMRFERQPIQISFILYKPKDKWQIQNLRFDDKIDDELDKLPNVVGKK
jgi:hypothetical protein